MAQAQPRLSPDEYLALDREAEIRSEFLDGEMFAMSGASLTHNSICVDVIGSLLAQLRGSGCQVFSQDLRVQISETGLYAYPDVLVVCGEPELVDDDHFDTLLNPALLVEVLSPSTEAWDRGGKFAHYRTLESLRGYVLVSQDRPLVEVYGRDGDAWILRAADRLEQSVELPGIDAGLKLAEIYERVDFETAG